MACKTPISRPIHNGGRQADGIYDNLTELLRLELPANLTPGVHTLAIRAADEAGNIGSLATTFEIK